MKYILAVLSGVLLILAFPAANLSGLAWIALVPLLVAIHDANWKQSFRLGFITGFIYFSGVLYWFIALGPFSKYFWVVLGVVALAAYLSSYVFMFTIFVNFVARYWIFGGARPYRGARPCAPTRVRQEGGGWLRWLRKLKYPPSSVQNLEYIFLTAVAWTGLEILRGHLVTGFPWACLAHTQYRILPLIQISSITGMYGVTFLIVMVNGAIASFFLAPHRWRSLLKVAVVPFVLLIATFVYGCVAMGTSSQDEKIRVLLVPGNVRQMEKLMSWGNAHWIFDKYEHITRSAIDEKPHLIVWPETSVPMHFHDMEGRLVELVREWKAYFLTGTPYIEYNAAVLVSPEGEVLDRYDKIHLVPVGEYVPLKRYMPESWQDAVTGAGDWLTGSEYTVFDAPPARFGVAICFESAFPGIFRNFVKKGANVMGIITNDAWFEGTSAAEQHYSMAPFRAIENRKSIFRCANYGVSCIIDPWGRTVKEMRPDPIFSLELTTGDLSELDRAIIPRTLKQVIADKGFALPESAGVLIEHAGNRWVIVEGSRRHYSERFYTIRKKENQKIHRGKYRVDIYHDKGLSGEVSLHPGFTLYTLCGDYFPWACLAMTVLLTFRTWWYVRRLECYRRLMRR